MGKKSSTTTAVASRPSRPERCPPPKHPGPGINKNKLVVEVELNFNPSPQTLLLLDKLLTQLSIGTQSLKRIEEKVDNMALNFDKLNAAVTKIADSQTALSASFDEVVKEFADLKTALADIPAAQEAINSFGDKLDAVGTQIAAQAQAFKDINPDTPAPEASSRRRS